MTELYTLRSTPQPSLQDLNELLDRIFRDTTGDENGCWVWTGSGGQYGRMTFKGQSLSLHRLSYELYKGPIPADLLVMHTCDNPRCINPFHLKLGTPADNTADMMTKGRYVQAVYGQPRMRWLTPENVRSIRQSLQEGVTRAKVARQFGVSWTTVDRIEKGLMWSNIT